MKSVLLIGMGQFGQILGEKLINMGDEVMIVDTLSICSPPNTQAP